MVAISGYLDDDYGTDVDRAFAKERNRIAQLCENLFEERWEHLIFGIDFKDEWMKDLIEMGQSPDLKLHEGLYKALNEQTKRRLIVIGTLFGPFVIFDALIDGVRKGEFRIAFPKDLPQGILRFVIPGNNLSLSLDSLTQMLGIPGLGHPTLGEAFDMVVEQFLKLEARRIHAMRDRNLEYALRIHQGNSHKG